ncbi:ion transporter [Escherichia albertii]|uniref:ion transporter n=1 Tax=Escherichia albertii TaxID=208962 RepID=UPI0010F8FFCA|nr:ion transporter [Escherichia albertii]
MAEFIAGYRQRVYHFLVDQHTTSGRRSEIIFGLLALLSVGVVFIESGTGMQNPLPYEEWHIYVWSELFFTFVFTVEYFLRVFSFPAPVRYIFSFWGFIDLATILPLYVLWLWPEIGANYLFAWRAMRAIRALRILRLLRFMPALNSLWVAIYNARHQLILFYSFIAIVLIVAGTLMYAVEGATNGFNSLGTSVYWAIVTVTTVGYGDITPHTDAGRIVASMLILIGYSVIAIPTGIIAAQLTSELEQTKKQRRCSKCNTQHHALDARYCRICGNSLMTEK